MQDFGDDEAATTLAAEALETFRELLSTDQANGVTSLKDTDFEQIVPLWSR